MYYVKYTFEQFGTRILLVRELKIYANKLIVLIFLNFSYTNFVFYDGGCCQRWNGQMIEETKENSSEQIKTLEQSTTLMNDLSFNLCVAPWFSVVRLVTYFRIEGSCQNRGPRDIE